MRTKTVWIAMLGAILVLTLSSGAWARDSFEGRQAKQRASIYQGMKSGRITESEFKALDAEQYRIETFRRKAVRDGYLDRSERRRLDRRLDRARRHIREARRHGPRNRHGRWSWHFRYDCYDHYDYWYNYYHYGPYWPPYGWRHRHPPRYRPGWYDPGPIRPRGRIHFGYHGPGFGIGWSIGVR